MGHRPRHAASLAKDEAGIVFNWLIKLIVGLVVVGVSLFEVVALALVRGTAADTAAEAASEAGFFYSDTHDLKRAEETAREYAESEGAEFISISIDNTRRTVTVTVRKSAKTLFVQRIGPLRRYATVEISETAPLPR